MKFGGDSIDTKGLDDILKLLRNESIKVKVGILGKNSDRDNGESEDSENELDNATVGMWHEFGNEKLPERSWLRMPLSEKLFKKLESSGAFDKKTIDRIVKEKSFVTFAKKLGLVSEECIQEAFDTGGFGKWEKSDMTNKKVSMTLVETQQLRRSVTSEVEVD